VEVYGDLQDLLGDHIIPVEETSQFVSIELQDILGQVVSMIMDGSSIVHVARYPNIIKRD
jgi:hypothetical protein